MLVALKTYQSGHGDKGKLKWNPDSTICDALEEAFYTSFKVRLSFFLVDPSDGCNSLTLNITFPSSLFPSLSLPPYLLFLILQFVQATGRRFLLALDVSGSMCSPILGSTSVTAREASAAMAMVTARTEANYHMVGFSSSLVPLNITAKMNLSNVVTTISKVSY